LDRDLVAHAAELAGLALDTHTEVRITGQDPVFDCHFHLGEGAAAALALVGQAASRLWELRGGWPQRLTINVRHAAASLVSFGLLSLDDGGPTEFAAPAMTDFFACREGRWIHLHGGFDDGRGTLEHLGLPPTATRDAIAAVTARHDAFQLEDALAAARLCGAAVRTRAEWDASPQGVWLAERPAVEIIRIGDSAPEPLPEGPRPMSGVRVLDLTRVLAGPTCARTLAEHGADVLHIASPRLPTFDRFEMDTGHGKRQAHLDLDVEDQARELRSLIRGGDVFSQGFRLGALARRGLGPADVATLRPGVVYVSENCYGNGGPWGERPGWEQLAQAATGIASVQGDEHPRLVPAAFNDYTTGYLGAAGAMEALRRRAVEGGSWHVRVSLAQTSRWFQRLGLPLDRTRASGLGDTARLMQERDSLYGRIRFLGPCLRMSETNPYWDLPPTPLGSGLPQWLPRAQFSRGNGK
jgi:crotonobetainyl-CoA:carnitine CoA-transferase CaiB-like acyl-CoA transferase